MNSVQDSFASQAQSSGYGATQASGQASGQSPSIDASGRFSGHIVVTSQPCRLCAPASPPPPYSEAMRQAQQGVPGRNNALVLNEVMKLMREDAFQVERRANHKGCCERLMGNGCCGDLLETCCVSACMIALSCLSG